MVVMLTGVALTNPLVVPRTRSDGPSRRRGLPGRCRCDSGLERLHGICETLFGNWETYSAVRSWVD